MSRYLCRETFREHHYRLVCEKPASVVWQDPATGIVHPRCDDHKRDVLHEATVRRWVLAGVAA